MTFPQRCYGNVLMNDFPSMNNVARLDYNALPLILKMQAKGILIDPVHFANLSKYLKSECDRITEQVRSSTGFYANLGSPDQVADLLFSHSKLGLKPPPHFKMTESGKRLVVNDEALSSIRSLHPSIALIQNFTECNKLRTSYSDVLPTLARSDGRVYTNLRVTRQVSGRISSSDPNLMAQPTRSDLGKKIREGFIAPKGRKLGTLDLSQIEMRTAAHCSGAASMIDTFLRDGDIHVETAVRIFMPELATIMGRMPNKKEALAAGMTSTMRDSSKRLGFGVLFGLTPEGLHDQITTLTSSDSNLSDFEIRKILSEWPLERCAKLMNDWFDIYPEMRACILQEHSKARRYGYVWDLFGRIRWIPEARSVHRWIMEAGMRQAFSMRISASATGFLKLAMAEINDKLIEGKYKGAVDPLLSVHDELLSEADEDVVEEFLYDSNQITQRVVRLDVPIKCSTAYGDNWGALQK